MGLLAGMFGAASYVPFIFRDLLLNLPSNSPLKQAVYHVAQRNNPDLSPQQIFSLTYYYQEERGHPLPPIYD
jgi:hypothetical protein